MKPSAVVRRFDVFLAARGLRLEAVVVGGAALELLGIAVRETRDCDVIHPHLPEAIQEAATEFARQETAEGRVLDAAWLNNGPTAVAPLLPPGWEERVQAGFSGRALTLSILGRADLLLTKLFALCDRGTDIGDCLLLQPTAKELSVAAPWVRAQDANPDWPAHVDATLADLARRLGHGV
jgi:hypothetical protein